jgi:hypothetical protein
MKKYDIYREYILCGKTTDNIPIYGMIIARNKKDAIKDFKERTNIVEVQFIFSSFQVRQASMGKVKEFFDNIGEKRGLRRLNGKPKNVDKLIKLGSI